MFCIDFVRVTNCFYDYDYDMIWNKHLSIYVWRTVCACFTRAI